MSAGPPSYEDLVRALRTYKDNSTKHERPRVGDLIDEANAVLLAAETSLSSRGEE